MEGNPSAEPSPDPGPHRRVLQSVGPPPDEPELHRLVSVADPSITQLASRLYGAKPIVWRGRSDLPQAPWVRPTKGCWLVIDLWSGIGGLPMALLQAGWHFYCLSAEMDEEAATVASQAMPNVVHISRVEDIQAQALVPFLRRRRVRGILVGGGSPCQGNSSLNKRRKGLDDPRSQQPLLLKDLRDQLRALPECEEVEILSLLENVGSMPDSVQAQYSEWMESEPTLVDAATCGWVHRRRLYWLASMRGGLQPDMTPPESWACALTPGSKVQALQWRGNKPLPPRLHLQEGYSLLLDPHEMVKNKGEGAMHTFTREFFHPRDRLGQASAAAAQRFLADNQRFPPAAYEEPSLAWKGSSWRPLLPEERAQLMGIPPEIFRGVKGPPEVRVQKANSFLGNGFHTFSILVLLSMVPQLLAGKIPNAILPGDEAALRDRCRHTVWEPGRLASFPGLLEVDEVINGVQQCFPDCQVDVQVWNTVRNRLNVCRLRDLQIFTAWCRLKQLPWHSLGPQPILRVDRAKIYAGLSGQRHPANSSKGLDHLLPPGLGKEDHMSASHSLPSPFAPSLWPDLDAQFFVDAIATWQSCLPRWAEEQRHHVSVVAKALQPLEAALSLHRVPSARQVAQAKQPAFVACMSVLLRWPDLQQPQQLIKGYPILGEFAPSGIFRPVPEGPSISIAEWLTEAPAAVERIMRSKPPLFAEQILKVTQEEQTKGFCSKFLTKEDLDARFGEGQWRPLERFLITQPCGKQRVIDNAKKTQHNRATTMSETIYTVHLDFIASVAANLTAKLGLTAPPMDTPGLDWLHLRLGTDDLPDAYRALPVAPSQQGYSVISIFVPGQGWRFTLLYGLAFGLESAVISFNRWPHLAIAIARRCTCSLSAAYFDDEMALETMLSSDVSQLGLRLVLKLMGSPPQPEKGYKPSPDRHYLGASIHLGSFSLDGVVRFQPKYSTTMKVRAKLLDIVQQRSLPADVAGKLRGDLQWMYSLCAGQLGRLVGPVLTARQASDQSALTSVELRMLQMLYILVGQFRPRDVPVIGACKTPFRIYSDASFEKGILRLGWVLFPVQGEVIGATTVVPDQVLQSWKPRDQQIFPGELLCSLVIPILYPDLLRDQDILWFIDNEAAVATLIRASSGESDIHLISQSSHIHFASLGAECGQSGLTLRAIPLTV